MTETLEGWDFKRSGHTSQFTQQRPQAAIATGEAAWHIAVTKAECFHDSPTPG